MRAFMMYILHKILGWSYKSTEVDMWHTWKNRKMHKPTELSCEDLKEKDSLEESGVDCKIIFKRMLQKFGGRM
jgi:hypothetical protein